MKTVDDIVAAVERLRPAQYFKLRKQLDRLEQRRWKEELAATTSELRRASINDQQIDQMVIRRRRESRS